MQREVAGRLETGRLQDLDLRHLLFAAPRTQEWAPLRARVLDVLTASPERSASVLSIEQHLSSLPAHEPATQAHGPAHKQRFATRVTQQVGAHTYVSDLQLADTKKHSLHLAFTSLLAHMTELPDPLANPTPDAAERTARIRGTAAPPTPPARAAAPLAPASDQFNALDRAGFRQALRGAGTRPPTDLLAHTALRARSGLLEPADAHWLLFRCPGAPWAAARAAALESTAAAEGTAAQILELYRPGGGALRRVDPEPVPGQPNGFCATAQLHDDQGLPHTACFTAASKDAARHGAAVRLLASLTGIQPPPTRAVDPARSRVERFTLAGLAALHALPNRAPAMTLHTAYQRGMCTKPEYTLTGGGKAPLVCRGALELSGERIEVFSRGTTSVIAKDAAAALLLLEINHQLKARADRGDRENAPAPADAPSPAAPGDAPDAPSGTPLAPNGQAPVPHARRPQPPAPHDPQPRDTAASPTTAESELEQLLRQGCPVTFQHPQSAADGAFLLHASRPAGSPQLASTLEDLLIRPRTGPEARRAPRAAPTSAPVLPGALALIAVPANDLHPSARAWAQAARLALSMIADNRTYPALSADGRAHWRLTPVPPPHEAAFTDTVREVAAHPVIPLAPAARATEDPAGLVHAFLDAFATAFTVSPGMPLLLGERPFLAEQRPVSHLHPWADHLATHADPMPAPAITIRIDPPEQDARTTTLKATLLLRAADHSEQVEAHRVWDGHAEVGGIPADIARRVARALRHAGGAYPPLHRLALLPRPERMLLSARDAAALLEPETTTRLAEAGIEITWSGQWTAALDLATVVKHARPEVEESVGLESLLYMEWQAVVDGQVLTDREMDELAEAHRPLVRVRGRWLLLDTETARRMATRRIAQLPMAEVLLDLLHGQVVIDGRGYACSPAAGLSEMIALVRGGERESELIEVPAGLTKALFAHQHRGFDWLARRTRVGLGACLADDMGLGKTLTAIALHLHHAAANTATRTLAVCPGSLVINWLREFALHAPHVPVRAYHGPDRDPADLAGEGVVITSYTTMSLDLAELTEHRWDLVFADEAQLMKNPETRTARSALALRAGARIALTGTPVENQLNELWAILNWVNPGLFGTRASFRRTYARPIEKPRDQHEHDQVRERLHTVTRPFLLRRLKSDPAIALNLPAKRERERIVALSRTQAGLYEAVRREALAALEHGKAGAGMTVLRLLHDLRMICNAPAHFHREAPETLLADAAANEKHAPKLEAVREIVDDACARGSATLIYTSYAGMGRLIQAHLAACGYDQTQFMHGEAPRAERQPMVDALQSGTIPVLVLTRRVGGVGLNLTRATEVVHYDPDWNPASEAQANDRAYRLGQTRDVTVHRLITEGSVEEKIASRADWKRRLADGAVPAHDLDLDDLDPHEIADLFELGDH